MSDNKNIKINCRKCSHYYITWDTNHPYGCKVMGFKGRQLPSIAVLNSTGHHCLLFKDKHIKQTKT